MAPADHPIGMFLDFSKGRWDRVVVAHPDSSGGFEEKEKPPETTEGSLQFRGCDEAGSVLPSHQINVVPPHWFHSYDGQKEKAPHRAGLCEADSNPSSNAAMNPFSFYLKRSLAWSTALFKSFQAFSIPA